MFLCVCGLPLTHATASKRLSYTSVKHQHMQPVVGVALTLKCCRGGGTGRKAPGMVSGVH